jgi:hypothetical protein
VQADSNLAVAVDGTVLPRRIPGSGQDGWFEPNGSALQSGSRGLFWDIAVNLPAAKRVALPGEVNLFITYDTVRTGVQLPPPLVIRLVSSYRDPSWPERPFRASQVFTHGDNSKPDNRAVDAIVARGVVVAGWLFEGSPGTASMPNRNDASGLRTGESEDYHYDVWLDNDFIRRNYPNATIEPLASAVIKGSPVPLFVLGAPAPPQIPLLGGTAPSAATFTIPGSPLMTAELNAWHKADRGAKPAGWIDDPDAAYPGNAWPFHPRRPLGISATDADLAPGDYVILSGTLWQDTSHIDKNSGAHGDAYRKCWDDRFRGHAGWLEIHPVDSVRRVPSPTPRKHTVMRAACAPEAPYVEDYLTPFEDPPPANAMLRHEVIIDDRFTTPNTLHTEVVETYCPTKLHIKINTIPNNGIFKATYVLWWETSSQPAPICTLPPWNRKALDDARQKDEEYEERLTRPQCLQKCAADRDECMRDATEPGGPRPAQCVQAHARCRNRCPV